MMELVDMPGMSAQFRICRMRTANSKKVGGTLNGPFCVPKLGVPQIWGDDLFCMRGDPFREKSPHKFAKAEVSKLNYIECHQKGVQAEVYSGAKDTIKSDELRKV